jgi:hypothetical protein
MQDAGTYECIATSSRATVVQQIHVRIQGSIHMNSVHLSFVMYINIDSMDHDKLEHAIRWSSNYSQNDYHEINEIAR